MRKRMNSSSARGATSERKEKQSRSSRESQRKQNRRDGSARSNTGDTLRGHTYLIVIFNNVDRCFLEVFTFERHINGGHWELLIFRKY